MNNLEVFENKTILVTGGTGSFGRKFAKLTLEKFNPKQIIIFSRDEMKQWMMAQDFSDPRIEFVIGDIRDKDSLRRVARGVDYIVHAAATKIVPLSEYNAFECVKTNILGSMNVIDIAIEAGVSKVVALSTDKASAPVNLYGATKLAADKLFVAANVNSRDSQTTFSVVRYGNVMGSRGSVIPFFLSLKNNGEIPITDLEMTRFMITLEQAIDIVWKSFSDSLGGEIYVRKIPSMKVVEIAKAISPKSKIKIIGIRPGEKLHEQMIGPEDSNNTFEYDEYYKILPTISDFNKDINRIKNGVKVIDKFFYNSNTNPDWMTQNQLQQWLQSNTEKVFKSQE
jgi:UDP-N-acetylglucosamine 4,6-dehydratase (inverting)